MSVSTSNKKTMEAEAAVIIGDKVLRDVASAPPKTASERGHYSWQDLTYHLGAQGSGNTKKILKGVTGYCCPGQTLAILGPSGAGKTTLLDLLACRNKKGVYTGELLLDGKEPTRAALKNCGGYVLQDDVFLGFLSVWETLNYSARLRLADASPFERESRVDEVLSVLGLSHVRDSRIGTQFIRGLSGGEKKRLSIGQELVTNPIILFLDEVCRVARKGFGM